MGASSSRVSRFAGRVVTKNTAWDAAAADRCGFGTAHGCGHMVKHPAVLVLNARERSNLGNNVTDDGHVLFCDACRPPGLVGGAFLKGWLAEIGA